MPFYIRKSISAGPFRFNFSKGGVGVSVGVKGLRIGTGPRGHYIHAGRGGLYYRASLGSAGRKRSSPSTAPSQPVPQMTFDDSDVTMVEVDSGDVMLMRDESFSELLNEINAKAAQIRMSAALSWPAIVIGLLVGFATGGPGLILCALALPGWTIGKWLDSYRRSTVLYYDLEGDAHTAFEKLTEGFDGLRSCDGKWHIEAGGAVQSLTAWKRNAGASHLVRRKATALTYSLPSVIKSNLSPPALSVGKQIMFFLPDVVLVQDGGKVGAVSYADLMIRWQDSRFIETERVPSDATVVDHTWAHPNKSGGPDRRFKNNRRIPVCLYETIHFQSNSGLNELVEFSKTGRAATLAEGCRMLAGLPRERSPALTAPIEATSPSVPAALVPAPVQERPHRSKRKLALILVAVFVGMPLAIAVLGSRGPAEKTSGVPQSSPPTITSPPAAALQIPTSEKGNFVPSSGVTSETARPSLQPSVPAAHPTPALSPQPPVAVAPPPSVMIQQRNSTSVVPSAPTKPAPSAVNGVAISAVTLREGPGQKYVVVTQIPKGAPLSIIEREGAWSHVRFGRTNGWVPTSKLGTKK
ncbi:SH3 domain-containing protein [Neorhizobium galegae]|uniref:SH3 domain-containing protein n=1 Tax=Neorhizobium galegae TaxID=399 RepID=UPI00127CE4FF|nr:SH3 domain-containing protein [Neorhizobium galegae]KAA9386834.1 DUF4236 domain-containing protein [Neorhizobium galegae]MCM2501968.1 DUF4236 domain-containing protein [Neorhizobium galegae]MCQ1774770.1 DUF4236 domain-containing protein [Neorhizobium galegae]MCQ1799694.1 DUF4236 domain-containing protein [Neorhizobium galegae]